MIVLIMMFSHFAKVFANEKTSSMATPGHIVLPLLVSFIFLIITTIVSSESNNIEKSNTREVELSSEDLQEIDDVMKEKFDDGDKPFKSVIMGIYHNYKSTYLGNRTVLDYVKSTSRKKSNSERFSLKRTTIQPDLENSSLKRKKKKKKVEKSLPYSYDGTLRYNVGPGVNVSLDMSKDIVNVNLDEDCLKEILSGRWDDDSDEGRGKKYGMISKILPLFILPFLIQSALIPFLVAKLKLLLVKSIVVGKLAIFLLIISAIKNNNKASSYEAVPAYYSDPPSRRSEMYNGYRVEGRPAVWVH